VILYGCLTEVCVRKTCFDLLERGYEVTIAEDACGSINPIEKDTALIVMRDAGATVLTTQVIEMSLK
jgi:nicotinamidase-related amidase